MQDEAKAAGRLAPVKADNEVLRKSDHKESLFLIENQYKKPPLSGGFLYIYCYRFSMSSVLTRLTPFAVSIFSAASLSATRSTT